MIVDLFNQRCLKTCQQPNGESHWPHQLLLVTVAAVTMNGGVAANDELSDAEQRAVRVVEGDILTDDRPLSRAIVKTRETLLWPDGIVPYSVSPELSVKDVMVINLAIQHWNDVSGITLKPLDELLDTSDPVIDSLHFIPGEVCASWVGRRGGQQSLWVAPNCNKGSVMHEIGHALGLEHEHTRPDRGNHIDIRWENIYPDKRHNFDVAPSASRMLGPYDFDSIMHYGPTTFSLNGQPTISPKYRSAQGMGQREAPSEGDLNGIAELYGADLSVVAKQFEDTAGSEIEVYVSNESIQGAHDIELSVNSVRETSLLVQPDQGWRCAAMEQSILNCKLDRLSASESSVLRLQAGSEILNNQISASVTSKTPDYDLVNNTSDTQSDIATLPPVQLSQEAAPLATVQDDALGKVSLTGAINPFWSGLLVWLCIKRIRVRSHWIFSDHGR
ncbi:MAG: M12 family metallopeptidase [Granulosicoccus sp.]|nr:M12 family metallopeptidase [Granulosicoccus sp.]